LGATKQKEGVVGFRPRLGPPHNFPGGGGGGWGRRGPGTGGGRGWAGGARRLNLTGGGRGGDNKKKTPRTRNPKKKGRVFPREGEGGKRVRGGEETEPHWGVAGNLILL